MIVTHARPLAPRRSAKRQGGPTLQTAIGLSLAAPILAAWTALHVYGVFVHAVSATDVWLAPPLICLQAWLATGMFIIAHDAMHGSLAPGRPRLNAFLGQLAVALYAGFSFTRLKANHFGHHRAPGTLDDPDFHPGRPDAFAAWYMRFFRTYFGIRELAVLAGVMAVYLALGVKPLNLALFWGAPALLSSLQLFVFGTWLPHRHTGEAFTDAHAARTVPMSWTLSLLTCYHFGRHHEHHLHPSAPWWKLPSVKP